MYLLQETYSGIQSKATIKLNMHLMQWWCLGDQKYIGVHIYSGLKAILRHKLYLKYYHPANETGTLYVDFFQFDTRTDTSKGIIAIDLTRWTP
ncbi:hypothetical protein CAL7102_08101 [Dulcicalothrix desertica PCC 7102]|nr:hypothetical protein CAL7102_08101 [Dulcicalothrix desertica PCC 7102]